MSSPNKISLLFLFTVAVLLVLCTSCLHSFTEAKSRRSGTRGTRSCQSTLKSCLVRATASRDSLQRARCSTDFTTCQKSRLVRSAKKRATRELLSDVSDEKRTISMNCAIQCSDPVCLAKCSRAFLKSRIINSTVGLDSSTHISSPPPNSSTFRIVVPAIILFIIISGVYSHMSLLDEEHSSVGRKMSSQHRLQ